MANPGGDNFTSASRALEFSKLLAHIAAPARSAPGRQRILSLRPLQDLGGIRRRLRAVAELRRLASEAAPIGLSPFEDVRATLEMLRPQGAVLEPKEILSFSPALENVGAIKLALAGREDLPVVREMASALNGHDALIASIARSIDSDGHILDSASYELAELREGIRKLEARITRRLEETTRSAEFAPFLQDTFITKRSGRWVLPVRMDSKGMVAGVVHDVSRSGETAFMEPIEIIGVSNELENLAAEARAEEIRILRALTARLRDAAGTILADFLVLVEFDALLCIANFSDRLGLREPELNTDGVLEIIGGRHPLLLVLSSAEAAAPREVIPLDLRLGGEDRVMLITGPNAGGKTVALKTAGILQCMAQSALPVPAREGSTFPVLAQGGVLMDLGDEQSVETGLSTFSAHITNISSICQRAAGGTLVLLDELGTGTDPAQGAAIGAAVLGELMERGALVMATSHLVDVMAYVERTPGMLNASMEFDPVRFEPLYRLVMGEPGQSHAIATAERYGLPARVLGRAKELLGSMRFELQELISDLKAKRMEHETALLRLERERAELRQRLDALGEERRRAMAKAYEEAAEVVAEVRRKVHEVLDEAKRTKSKTTLKKIQEHADDVARHIEPPADPAYEPLDISEIEPGMTVHLMRLGYDAEVLSIDAAHKRMRVRAGGKEIEIPAEGIARPKGRKARTAPSRMARRAEEDELESASAEAAPSMEIKLIGLRVDEALDRLEPFLAQASRNRVPSVRIIHGIGTGALRNAVRSYLAGHPAVESFAAGEPAEGGGGVTVAVMR